LIPLCLKLIPFAISIDGVFIVLFSVLLFIFCLTSVIVFIIGNYKEIGQKRFSKYELLLPVTILIVAFPLLTETYLYYDDWWVIDGQVTTTLQSLLRYGRPFQSLVHVVFGDLTIENAYVFKWFYLPILILFSILLFRWVKDKSQNEFLSFFLACVVGLFGPAMDLLGYTSTSMFTVSILFTVFSVICIDKAYSLVVHHAQKTSMYWFALAVVSLFAANFAYQLGPQIFFFFLAIELYLSNDHKINFKKYFTYALSFALSNGLYLLFFRVLHKFSNAEFQTNRSSVVHSIGQIREKAGFYWGVIKQSLYQIFTSFTGNLFVSQRYHGYYISFTHNKLGTIVLISITLFIVIGLIAYWIRTKNALGSLLLLLFIPLTYYGFLLLSESGYLTYYAYAHISILLFYFLMGVVESLRFIAYILGKTIKKLRQEAIQNQLIKVMMLLMLVVIGLVSNIYIRDFYIKYNTVLYEYVKNNIVVSLDTGERSRIHVYGNITPLNADVYSRFIVEAALRDLGKEPNDYLITYSKYKNLLERIEEKVFVAIEDKVSAEEYEFLLNFYTLSPHYRQYTLTNFPSEQDQVLMQDIFKKAGLLPDPMGNDSIIIDITWTQQAYYNP
jgi:hypothetical protein